MLEHWTAEDYFISRVPEEDSHYPKPPSGCQPVPLLTMSRSLLRLKYRKFEGDGKEVVDDWHCKHNSLAIVNQEEITTKLRNFQGLTKKEALQLYQDVPKPIRNDREQLTVTFYWTFQEVGVEAWIVGKLSKMKMERDEFVQKYGQRVRSLIHKRTLGIAGSIQIEWYVTGFSNDMGFCKPLKPH